MAAPDGARVCPVPALSAAAQVATYRAAGAEFRAEQRSADERAAALPDALDARRIVRGGVPVSYVSAGAGGPPVVVVNAIGHGLWYWYPLLERLLRRHPVLVWETRTCGLADQVDDLAAILDQEGIDECHLLGWGTGAKAAGRPY